ncbi:hypothetical protein BLA50215_02789 [Burkholderia lata]|uniref:hypothetical protein n=1 Tax=Burkholderia lata (strain ATCC 17760 / DSM 23089 / LMG 22485 / NCIMB 9086 / R18194 / 383) TaxID=482957 RepID=UPI0014549135|nr:hypothetical protein [Burkholderia lata]VWD04276.1 hypothetical protein BLA50215_02789 [Burkholderia lata]
MDENIINDFLLKVPGARRSAQGLMIPLGDGGFFHVLGQHSAAEMDGLTDDESFYLAFCAKKEIFRLREIRSAHDYLLRLRANAIVDFPRLVRVMDARRAEYERTGRPWSLTHYYHSKDHYYKSYINLLQKADAKVVKKTPSGLIFANEVNAMCIRSLAGDVVVASECLEYFYYFMTIALYGESFDVEIVDRIDALLIAIRLVSGVEALDFDIDPRGRFDAEVERKVRQLVANQMKFTFGHEYAHLLCGHLAGPDVLVKLNGFDGVEDSRHRVRAYSHEIEFQADFFSLKNVSHNSDAFNAVAHGAFSVLIFLYFIDLVSGFCKLPKFSVSITHPTPRDRIEALHKIFGRKSPFTGEMLSDSIDVVERLAKLFEGRVLNSDRKDILTFYGSIYLSGYTDKLRRDRYDF